MNSGEGATERHRGEAAGGHGEDGEAELGGAEEAGANTQQASRTDFIN